MFGAKRKSRAYLNLITHVKTTIATLKCDFVLPTSYIIQVDQPGVESFKQGTTGEWGDDTQSPAESS